jgi:D-glycero-alpha-D-manno-heptose-7-phosphate kinase
MIVTRTPFRVPLGGGGTDLPSYYSKYGGFLVSAAINKYVYITVNKRFENSIRVSYSRTEIVDEVNQIQHPIVREALKLLNIDRGIEITSIADVPAKTGLGSSSSFTVGLLKALHTFKREPIPTQDLAEEACHLEIDILGEPIGKQDQYLAAFGGVTSLDIDRSGKVKVNTHILSDDAMDQLESNILLLFTGIQRSASEVLNEQNRATKEDERTVVNRLHKIKELGKEIEEALRQGNVRRFGELLDVHWQTKKGMSQKISKSQIDLWYDAARENGALGGKIMGAGGGGFFMFYCDNGKTKFRKTLKEMHLREMRFRIDTEGSKVLVNV